MSDEEGEAEREADTIRFTWLRAGGRTARAVRRPGCGGHTVRTRTTGTENIHHPIVGDLTIGYEGLAPASTPGPSIMTSLAPPATRLQTR